MFARTCLVVGLSLTAPLAFAQFGAGAFQDPIPGPGQIPLQPQDAPPVEDAPAPKPASSAIKDVTVYQGTALVAREVAVPAGKGLVEVVVTPLPAQAIPSSLYTEGTDAFRVLSTRYRARAVREDTRQAVRAKEEEIKKLQAEGKKLQADAQAARKDQEFVQKLEGFTAATTQHLLDQGKFDSDQVIGLSKYLMQTRSAKAEAATDLERRIQENAEAVTFAQRQLNEISAGSSRTAIDAVILVDKADEAAGKLRLNYLVNAATWRPQYRLRAGGEDDPVILESLAAITQQSAEDWADARITLSTAQPALNAAPPDLVALNITVSPGGEGEKSATLRAPAGMMMGMGGMGMGGMGGGMGGMGGAGAAGAAMEVGANMSIEQYRAQAGAVRGQAQQILNKNDARAGGALLNTAAAIDQAGELLAGNDDDKPKGEGPADGPTVTFRLKGTLTVPSRRDALLVEVSKAELTPEFFDKAVPVLTPRVYRLANLVNSTDSVLLAGEATMYVGTDFVGRMTMPLVAAGEPFTVGFGVDPQVQIYRRLLKKAKAVQGGNQVHTYDFRISARSFRAKPVKLQVWDRLPKPADEDVAVNLVEAKPDLSQEAAYQRNARNDNLLRWDIVVEPTQPKADPETILYKFRLEFAREMAIDQISAGALAEAPIGAGAGGTGGGFR